MTFAKLFEWWRKEYGVRLRGDNEAFARKRLLPALGSLGERWLQWEWERLLALRRASGAIGD